MQAWDIDYTDQFHRWYDRYVPIADNLYDTHLDELRNEGLL